MSASAAVSPGDGSLAHEVSMPMTRHAVSRTALPRSVRTDLSALIHDLRSVASRVRRHRLVRASAHCVIPIAARWPATRRSKLLDLGVKFADGLGVPLTELLDATDEMRVSATSTSSAIRAVTVACHLSSSTSALTSSSVRLPYFLSVARSSAAWASLAAFLAAASALYSLIRCSSAVDLVRVGALLLGLLQPCRRQRLADLVVVHRPRPAGRPRRRAPRRTPRRRGWLPRQLRSARRASPARRRSSVPR